MSVRTHIKERFLGFARDMLFSPLILTIFGVFVLSKLGSNMLYGASLPTAFRSALLGPCAYIAGLSVIAICSGACGDASPNPVVVDVSVRNRSVVLLGAYSVVLLFSLAAHIRFSLHMANGTIGMDNGWIENAMAWTRQKVAMPLSEWIGLQPSQVGNILFGNVVFVLLPFILWRSIGVSFRGVVFSLHTVTGALPLLVIYIVRYSLKGYSKESLLELLYAILYVGFCEEFFNRGIVLRTLSTPTSKVGTVVGISALYFAFTHLPSMILSSNDMQLIPIISSLASLAAYGLILGYGYKKTGMLWPWILVHAMEDALFL